MFGTQSVALDALRSELASYPWFAKVGEPIDDQSITRVGFDFVANASEKPYDAWAHELSDAESNLERLMFDNSRLLQQSEIQKKFTIGHFDSDGHLDRFITSLDERFGGPGGDYYKDSLMYPHELVWFPNRLIFGAAMEVMLADLGHQVDFFRNLLPWFQRGHWPLGVRYPNSVRTLLVW